MDWHASMRMDEYQHASGATAFYPERGSGSAMALAYVGLGLGEVGELQGKIKKILRDDAGVVLPATKDALVDELGDVLWYAAQLAFELGVPLSDVAARNLEKLQSRATRGTLGGSGDTR